MAIKSANRREDCPSTVVEDEINRKGGEEGSPSEAMGFTPRKQLPCEERPMPGRPTGLAVWCQQRKSAARWTASSSSS